VRRSAPAGGEPFPPSLRGRRGPPSCIVDDAADETSAVSSPPDLEPGPFVPALRRTARSWGTAAGLAAAATLAIARSFGALPCVHAAGFLLAGLVGIPLLFPLALGAAMAVLWALLAVVAVPWWLVQRRATGLAALWRVDRPVLWGLVLGFVVGTGLAVAVFSLRPPTA
jgi:hypothetical protein